MATAKKKAGGSDKVTSTEAALGPGAHRDPVERIVHVRAIDADYAWNCRYEKRTRSEGPSPDMSVDGDPDEPGIEGFAGGLEAVGQEVPAVGYPYPEPTAGKELRLVVGFRRFSAAAWLEEHGRSIKGLEPGQLRMLVYPTLTEAQARRMNIGENVARKNLTTPDLVFAVRELFKVGPADGGSPLTGEQLATMYGKSKTYMTNIVKVATKLREGTFRRWRESLTKPLPLVELSRVADLIASEQEDAYQQTLDLYEHKRGSADDRAWYKSALRKARDVGTMIGRAQRRGILTLHTDQVFDDEDTELIRLFVRFRTKLGKSRVPQKTVTKVSDAFTEAYLYARDHTDEDEDQDEGSEEV